MRRKNNNHEVKTVESILRETYSAKIAADEATARYQQLRKTAIEVLRSEGSKIFQHYDGTLVVASIHEAERPAYEKAVDEAIKILQQVTPENAFSLAQQALEVLTNPKVSRFFVLRFSVKE